MRTPLKTQIVHVGRYCLSIWLCIVLGLAWVQQALSEPVKVPQAFDFEQDAEHARRVGVPLLVMVASETCSYCELLKREVIRPMIISRAYEDKILIRELMLESAAVVDFDGALIPADEFARRYKARLTPTVLLLGPDGTELVPRTVGISNIEFYGYYLDQSIEQASAALNPS